MPEAGDLEAGKIKGIKKQIFKALVAGVNNARKSLLGKVDPEIPLINELVRQYSKDVLPGIFDRAITAFFVVRNKVVSILAAFRAKLSRKPVARPTEPCTYGVGTSDDPRLQRQVMRKVEKDGHSLIVIEGGNNHDEG